MLIDADKTPNILVTLGLHKADKISREQYSYALRSINLYFRLKDGQ